MTSIPTTTVPIDGTAEERFAGVRAEFESRLGSGEELGASLVVLIDGSPVVDLWGGWADPAETSPWQRDTITNVWSISKTVSALAALVLIDRGLLDPDRPVADYWPEFAVEGKESVLVRHVLNHTSGVSGWAQPIAADDILDVDAAAARLAGQPAWWPAGVASGYHLLDYGHLVGELVRRVSGRPLGVFVAEELTGPLGADFWLGLPESEDHRVSNIVPPPPGQLDLSLIPPDSPAFKTFIGPGLDAEITWSREWRAAGIGGAGGHGNARSVARLTALITGGGEVDGIRLLRPETVERVFADHTDGIDLVLGIPLRFGIGYATPHPASTPFLPEGRVAFWGGWGGSLLVADADRGLTIAYVMNKMSPGIIGSDRSQAYAEAIYAAI